MPGHTRAHYRGEYPRKAAAVRAHAYAHPDTRCWTCGLTLTQIRIDKPHAEWDAGHLEDGQINGELRAQCSPCNRSQGAAAGNRKREPHSRRWQHGK